MQVILKENIKGFGRKGEVKNVKDGYFHNYLLPRRLAELATSDKVAQAKKITEHYEMQKEKIREQAHDLKKKIDGVKVTIKAKSKGEKLYGSITEKEVLSALGEKTGVQLGHDNLMLTEHIKLVGSYEIPVHLTDGVEARFTLEVKAEK